MLKNIGLPQMFAKINLATLGPSCVTSGHTRKMLEHQKNWC